MQLSGRTESELLIVAAYMLLAGVNTMPKPGQKFEFYPWLYDWAHTMLNSPMVTRFERKLDMAPNGSVTETKTVSSGTVNPPSADAK